VPKVVGQEDYVYVWTGGIADVGDGSDKLVTVDANPDRASFAKVLSSVSVGGRHEVGGAEFTDDRRTLWAAGLADGKIFVFDVVSDPARPRLVKTIDSLLADAAGPGGAQSLQALPGRMLVTGAAGGGARGAPLVEYRNDGHHVATMRLPNVARYGYDSRVQPRLNRMLTTSFAGPELYSREPARALADPAARAAFGNVITVSDFHARTPLQVLEVPGGPLDVRWALQPVHDYAFALTAFGSELWLVARQRDGTFSAESVARIGDATENSLPVAMSLSLDDRLLFVNTLRDGTCHIYDVSDPRRPHELGRETIGSQVGMVAQTWYGRHLYFASSFLSHWDRKGAGQFLKSYAWDGKRLAALFAIDFLKEGLGRPRAIAFGQDQFSRNEMPSNGTTPGGPRAVDVAQYDYTFAFGTFRPDYVVPTPGTYELPVIGRVSDHALLTSEAERADLVGAKKRKLAVVAFVYTSCHEITGCPFSLGVMQRLDRAIAAEPELARAVRLITVSFDPTRDTPAKLSALRALHKPKTDWLFATTSSERELEQILADFDQPLAKLRFEDGSWSGVFRHVLKVFLLDRDDEIRNVYSVGFLNSDLVIADLRTLVIERKRVRPMAGHAHGGESSLRKPIAGSISEATRSAESGRALAATKVASNSGISRMPPPIAPRIGAASVAVQSGVNNGMARASRAKRKTPPKNGEGVSESERAISPATQPSASFARRVRCRAPAPTPSRAR
jgi:selenium-binding protein 1